MNNISDKTLFKIQQLYNAFLKGAIPKLSNHEVNPDLPLNSVENYIYFTLPCAINYQRSSPAMWASALATYTDEETKFLFDPNEVVQHPFKDIQKAMIKNKLALKTNKDPDAWFRNSKTLNVYYEGNPQNILIEGDYSIKKIIFNIQKKNKPLFPYLSGIKLSNYWLFILSRFTDAKFIDPYELSIIPDVHIIKASKLLSIVSEGTNAKDVEDAWKPILEDLKILPSDMHSTLWHWSRSGFKEYFNETF